MTVKVFVEHVTHRGIPYWFSGSFFCWICTFLLNLIYCIVVSSEIIDNNYLLLWRQLFCITIFCLLWFAQLLLWHNFEIFWTQSKNYYCSEIVLISYSILGGWLRHMIVYFVLSHFIYYDLCNCCYGIILRHFGPSLKLLLWWGCFNLI